MQESIEKQISSVENIYKNISEQQVPNINYIKKQLENVKYFIINNNLLIYGGIAIDYALKLKGHEGIYTEDTLPDYDFFSPENIKHSFELCKILDDDNIQVKNANHLTTRRVRYNKYTTLADISYYPQNYYDIIKSSALIRDEIKIVNPYFQKIDIYRSLAFLYEGSPGREYFQHRMNKDLKRLSLLNSICDINTIRGHSKITVDYMVGNLYSTPKQHVISKKKVCYTGFAALHLLDSNFTLNFPGPIEYFVDDVIDVPNATYFIKTFNIFPQAAYTGDEMIYMSKGDVFTATYNSKYDVYVASPYYLAAQFLFKYIMLGHEEFLTALLYCEKISGKIITSYFGSNYINKTWYYSEKNYIRSIKGKKLKNYRPGTTESTNCDTNIYKTYMIDGRKTDKFDKKILNYD